MKSRNHIGYNILCIGLFLSILYSMQIWTAKLNILFINNLPYLFLLLAMFDKNLWDGKRGKIFLSIIYIAIWGFTRDYDTDFFQIRTVIPIVMVILLKKEYYSKLIISLTKMFAMILIPAIILHLLIKYVPIPPFGMFSDPLYGYYSNYIFNIHSLSVYSDRFNACFCEPGHLGMIMAFIIYINNFCVKKWYVLVCLIALFLTLSLAGYVLLLLGFLLFSLSNNYHSKVFKYLISGVFLTFIIYYIAIDYNGGHNYVNEKIIQRLKYDEERGIKGNNRTNAFADSYFESVGLSDLFIGLRNREIMSDLDINGAGYKMFIIEYGIFSLVLTFVLYFIFYKKSPQNKRKYCLGLLILYSAAFIQRAYPFWPAWLIPYICYCMDISFKKNNIKIKNVHVLTA